jgi:hypothetical protein
MESLNKKAEAEAEIEKTTVEKAPEKKWKLVERTADSEETTAEQDAPAEDSPAEEEAK